MKFNLLSIIPLSLLFYFFTSSYMLAQEKGKPIETIVYDLDRNGETDSVFLYRLPENEQDIGLFERIEIKFDNEDKKEFRTLQPWDKTDTAFKPGRSNAVESELVFIHSENDRSLIFLFTHPDGLGSTFSIIEICNGDAAVILSDEAYDTLELKDFDLDGFAELLFRHWPELYSSMEDIGADIGTYVPYLIYRLRNPVIIDSRLTQEYNEEHYLWAGPKLGDNIPIVYPRDGSRPYRLNK